MRNKFLATLVIIMCLGIASFVGAGKDQFFTVHSVNGSDTLALNIPEGWPEPVYDFEKNPLTKSGIKLGRKLFYDNNLSRDSSISCASCHLSYTNFTHIDHKLSHGIEDRIGDRNTLAIMNPAWQPHFMWDGGITGLDVQPLAPFTAKHEMDMDMKELIKRLKSTEEYKLLFKEAFGKKAKISGYYLFRALSQFMLTFTTYNSKYDKVMRKEGDIRFTEREQKGLNTFREKCASCHTEPLFTNHSFENNGLSVNAKLNDMGRMKITNDPKDSLKFRVPSLRNIEVSYPYMHDGRFRNLQMVLAHYSNGVENSATLSSDLTNGIELVEDEKRNLVIFLKTLTDEKYLRNPGFAYPRN